ncbi:hypothetical protein B0A48_13346 [Cryoendolithus antarcticus]|uniref:Transcription factor domain-containing protein n=1 Tax=Cryoendolithus antarcticus TaxID=1507870 RepID=A0A1V8SPN1_9PEZI|nr:hypothetical protein B0A48_13346 [Cryoendolithus antarcticus]
MQQRQSVMASDIWRTARLPPEQGCINPRDSLLDTMMNIPELLQRHDLLKQRCNLVSNGLGDQDRSSLLDDGECLLRDCSTTVEALRGWEMRTLEHLVASASHDVDPPTTLRQICKDYGYGFFHTVMYYWTGSILLKGQMWFTFALLSRLRLTAELSEHPKPSLPPNIDPREDAENIAANIMHYFESEAGLWGAQIAAFPLGAALHFFIVTEGSSSPSKQRLIATVGESSKAAYTLAFLASAAAETVPPDIRGDAADGKTHAGMASRWFSGESKAVTEVSSEAP